MIKSASVSSGRNNVKVETVIQRHPAPLVPVWIGSSLDDDGLDGSVLNDLVMVMGEIVVVTCRCNTIQYILASLYILLKKKDAR